MTGAITFWLHILAVTVWVGPQLFLFLAAMPGIRLIDDPTTRARVMRVMTRRFGYLAAAAMIIIILTGLSNLGQNQDDTGLDIYSFDFRYSWIFLTKMILVGLTIGFTLLHGFVTGPRLLRLQEAASGQDASGGLRALSIVVSALNLLIAIAIIYAASLLANHSFSFQPV